MLSCAVQKFLGHGMHDGIILLTFSGGITVNIISIH